ncbi:NAD+ diphosphatase [Micromonospora phaseoli]|uniref:NAD(+) diphosphatase n=1 Tax=Micromonospora phaseoli TaxID=1144548 RepID=A0A1H6UX68_9ACTN|nr:NAD(+) diphosphatase [Micromonospora phaseoli]PZV93833.1 NAD+ diphosphatase [Micromonospora phaseoli]GIJ80723.1 NADH pyrophosphatase [Micromonospora phaseoli]SEI96246.1 NAD+ diphosphatase [Micromonospora phaseoli]
MIFNGLAYTATPHDRAASLRTDPDWVADQLRRDDSRVLPMWRDRPLLTAAGRPATLTGASGRTLVAAAGQTTLLGLDGPTAIFAADLSEADEADALQLGAAHASADLRSLAGTLPATLAATLAYARGLLYWNRHTRYCGTCGAATASAHAGHLRVCRSPTCGRQHFPRIEPAVLVLVESPGPQPHCLLARHHGAAADGFSLLAGFVEIGESLEGAVRREVAEEAGVRIGQVTYRSSQGWPFPAGLMVGFVARAVDETIAVDGAELVEARWFTRAEIVERIVHGPGSGPVDSIGGWLLRSWAGLG